MIITKYFDVLTEFPEDREFRETLFNETTGTKLLGNLLTITEDSDRLSKSVLNKIDSKYYNLSFKTYKGKTTDGQSLQLDVEVADVDTSYVNPDDLTTLYALKVDDDSMQIYAHTYEVCGEWKQEIDVEAPYLVSDALSYTYLDNCSPERKYLDTERFYNVSYKQIQFESETYKVENEYDIINDTTEESEIKLKRNGQFYDVYTQTLQTSGNITYVDGVHYIARNLPYQLHGEITKVTIDGKEYDKQYYYVTYKDDENNDVWINTNTYSILNYDITYGEITDDPAVDYPDYDKYCIREIGNTWYAILYKSSDYASEAELDYHLSDGESVDLSNCVLITLTPYKSVNIEYNASGQRCYYYYVEYKDLVQRTENYDLYTDPDTGKTDDEGERPTPGEGGEVTPDEDAVVPSGDAHYTITTYGDYWFKLNNDGEYYVYQEQYKLYDNGALEDTGKGVAVAGPLERVLDPSTRQDVTYTRPRYYRVWYKVSWTRPDGEVMSMTTVYYEDTNMDDDTSENPANEYAVQFYADDYSGTVSMSNLSGKSIQYAIGSGEWQNWDGSEIELITGQHLYLKGVNTSLDGCVISTTGALVVKGNISALFNSASDDVEVDSYACRNLFTGCASCLDFSGLNLNAGSNYCYDSCFKFCTYMTKSPKFPNRLYESEFVNCFYGCQNLVTVQDLPSVDEIPDYCFYQCFCRCRSLSVMPEMPSTKIGSLGYKLMFSYCSNLSTQKVLPVKILGESAMAQMFSNTNLTQSQAFTLDSIASSALAGCYKGCENLVKVGNITVDTLADNCFNSMFYGCSKLTSTGTVNTSTLADYCFCSMYQNCTSLTSTMALDYTLAQGCYMQMFQGCTSLTTAPQLPQSTGATAAYYSMFKGCSRLTEIDCNLRFTGSFIDTSWVDGVASTGKFIKNPYITEYEYSINCIPVGWTVEDNDYVKATHKKEFGASWEFVEVDKVWYARRYYYDNVYDDADTLIASTLTTEYYDLLLETHFEDESTTVSGLEVYYKYVEFEGVRKRIDEYYVVNSEQVETYSIQQEGYKPDFTYYMTTNRTTKYYLLLNGEKTYIPEKETSTVVSTTDITSDYSKWTTYFGGDSPDGYQVINGNVYVVFKSTIDEQYLKYDYKEVTKEASTTSKVTRTGDFPDYSFSYDTTSYNKYYFNSVFTGGKTYVPELQETVKESVDITDDDSYWTYAGLQKVDVDDYETWTCTKDSFLVKYKKINWIEYTTEPVKVVYSDFDNAELSDPSINKFYIKIGVTHKYYYVNYKGELIFDDSKSKDEVTTTEITDLSDYWTYDRTTTIYSESAQEDIGYFVYKCKEDETVEMYYKYTIGWTTTYINNVVETSGSPWPTYTLNRRWQTVYGTQGKFGEVFSGEDVDHPSESGSESIDVSDVTDSTYWMTMTYTYSEDGTHKYETYQNRYDDDFYAKREVFTVRFYGYKNGLDNQLLASYEDKYKTTKIDIPVPENPDDVHVLSAWSPALDLTKTYLYISKSVDYYAQYDYMDCFVYYCEGTYNADGTHSVTKTLQSFTVKYLDATPSYTYPDSSSVKFICWQPDVAETVTQKNTYYIAKTRAWQTYKLTVIDWYGNTRDERTLKEGTKLGLYLTQPSDLSETMTFKGWYYLQGETKKYINSSIEYGDVISRNITLYEDYNNAWFTVNFYDRYDLLYQSQQVRWDNNVTPPEMPNYDDALFVKWKSDIVNPVTADADYYPYYSDDYITVNFIDNFGTTFASVRGFEGETFTVPDIPDIDGYAGSWDTQDMSTTFTVSTNYTCTYTWVGYLIRFLSPSLTVVLSGYYDKNATVTEPVIDYNDENHWKEWNPTFENVATKSVDYICSGYESNTTSVTLDLNSFFSTIYDGSSSSTKLPEIYDGSYQYSINDDLYCSYKVYSIGSDMKSWLSENYGNVPKGPSVDSSNGWSFGTGRLLIASKNPDKVIRRIEFKKSTYIGGSSNNGYYFGSLDMRCGIGYTSYIDGKRYYFYTDSEGYHKADVIENSPADFGYSYDSDFDFSDLTTYNNKICDSGAGDFWPYGINTLHSSLDIYTYCKNLYRGIYTSYEDGVYKNKFSNFPESACETFYLFDLGAIFSNEHYDSGDYVINNGIKDYLITYKQEKYLTRQGYSYATIYYGDRTYNKLPCNLVFNYKVVNEENGIYTLSDKTACYRYYEGKSMSLVSNLIKYVSHPDLYTFVRWDNYDETAIIKSDVICNAVYIIPEYTVNTIIKVDDYTEIVDTQIVKAYELAKLPETTYYTRTINDCKYDVTITEDNYNKSIIEDTDLTFTMSEYKYTAKFYNVYEGETTYVTSTSGTASDTVTIPSVDKPSNYDSSKYSGEVYYTNSLDVDLSTWKMVSDIDVYVHYKGNTYTVKYYYCTMGNVKATLVNTEQLELGEVPSYTYTDTDRNITVSNWYPDYDGNTGFSWSSSDYGEPYTSGVTGDLTLYGTGVGAVNIKPSDVDGTISEKTITKNNLTFKGTIYRNNDELIIPSGTTITITIPDSYLFYEMEWSGYDDLESVTTISPVPSDVSGSWYDWYDNTADYPSSFTMTFDETVLFEKVRIYCEERDLC